MAVHCRCFEGVVVEALTGGVRDPAAGLRKRDKRSRDPPGYSAPVRGGADRDQTACWDYSSVDTGFPQSLLYLTLQCGQIELSYLSVFVVFVPSIIELLKKCSILV